MSAEGIGAGQSSRLHPMQGGTQAVKRTEPAGEESALGQDATEHAMPTASSTEQHSRASSAPEDEQPGVAMSGCGYPDCWTWPGCAPFAVCHARVQAEHETKPDVSPGYWSRG